jgi:outer membrane protein assembly factor BamA
LAEEPTATAPDAFTAPANLTGKVTRVEITGLKRVEEAVILDSILLRIGEDLEPWKLQRDIKAVWRTGYVQDVVV